MLPPSGTAFHGARLLCWCLREASQGRGKLWKSSAAGDNPPPPPPQGASYSVGPAAACWPSFTQLIKGSLLLQPSDTGKHWVTSCGLAYLVVGVG